jgi:ubiquinone/menaquinone biosynthesis C-methylase UbiE
MNWLRLPRKPEKEVMGDADEVEAYASATAQAFLDSIDNTLVEQVLTLGPPGGMLLDIGVGPGNICLKIARCCPGLQVVGVDYSQNMVRAARQAASEQGLTGTARFCVGDANRLCLPDACFDFVISNSVLHHLSNPVAMLKEMVRVARPAGVILLRDLRRPSRLAFPLHVRWHGRFYSGLMYRLFQDSLRAAYTGEELAELLHQSDLHEARVFYHERTHLGFIRDGRRPAETIATRS